MSHVIDIQTKAQEILQRAGKGLSKGKGKQNGNTWLWNAFQNEKRNREELERKVEKQEIQETQKCAISEVASAVGKQISALGDQVSELLGGPSSRQSEKDKKGNTIKKPTMWKSHSPNLM